MRLKPDAAEARPSLGPLFDVPEKHLAARTDPQTSRDAARVAHAHLGKAQEVALAFVRHNPGSTAKELGDIASARYGIPDKERMRQRIGRRLNELEKAGLIRRDGQRDGCSCWWPADKEAR